MKSQKSQKSQKSPMLIKKIFGRVKQLFKRKKLIDEPLKLVRTSSDDNKFSQLRRKNVLRLTKKVNMRFKNPVIQTVYRQKINPYIDINIHCPVILPIYEFYGNLQKINPTLQIKGKSKQFLCKKYKEFSPSPLWLNQQSLYIRKLPEKTRLDLYSYASTNFGPINRHLRSRFKKLLPKIIHKKIKRVRLAIENSPPTTVDIVVYRYTNLPKDKVLHIGEQYTDQGFISTSYAINAFGDIYDKNTLFRIFIPKGTRVLSMDSIAMYEEHEILLLPGTSFDVISENMTTPSTSYKNRKVNSYNLVLSNPLIYG